MRIENEVPLPVSPAEAWPVLLDLERVAPCLPGAEIIGVDGDAFEGKAKIKVGPITAEYKGVAEIVGKDENSYQATIKATGKDSRGQGNASANVTARLVSEDTGSRVFVETDLNITGKVAQFGQGIIQDAASGIISTFAENLGELMRSQNADVNAAGNVRPKEEAPGPAVSRAEDGGTEALDVLKVARGTATSRSQLPTSRAATTASVVAGGVSVIAAAWAAGPSAVAVVAAGVGAFAAGYSLRRA